MIRLPVTASRNNDDVGSDYIDCKLFDGGVAPLSLLLSFLPKTLLAPFGYVALVVLGTPLLSLASRLWM